MCGIGSGPNLECCVWSEVHVRKTVFTFLLCDAYAVMQCWFMCLSVCVSVTFVSCVKTNKHIIKNILPSGSHAILVFLCQVA